MSTRRFAPSFVMTVSALAVSCSKPPPKDIEPVKTEQDAGKVGSASSKEELPPPQNPPSVQVTKKRVRTDKSKAPPKFSTTGGDLTGYTPQNPTDGEGHMIFVAYDDSCFVRLPRKDPPTKPLPPGMPWWDSRPIDCPAELDDAAWDGCSGGELMASKSKNECFCYHEGGNPPPPPFVAECPKHKK